MKKLRKRRAKKAARKRELQAERRELEARLEKFPEKIREAKAELKLTPPDSEEREAAADRLDFLVGERKRLEAEVDDVAADLGEVNAVLRRLARRAKKAAQKKLARQRYWASENFRYDEFNCHEGGPVPGYMYDDLRELCQRILEPMRDKFGPAHVNSGHRWRFYNIKIGGALFSQHEYELRRDGPAADCTFAKGTPAEWAAYARQLAGIGGVGQYSSFVHVDTGPRRDWSG